MTRTLPLYRWPPFGFYVRAVQADDGRRYIETSQSCGVLFSGPDNSTGGMVIEQRKGPPLDGLAAIFPKTLAAMDGVTSVPVGQVTAEIPTSAADPSWGAQLPVMLTEGQRLWLVPARYMDRYDVLIYSRDGRTWEGPVTGLEVRSAPMTP